MSELATKVNSEQAIQMLEKLKEKRKTIANAEGEYKTDGNFKWSKHGGAPSVQLHTTMSLEELLHVLGFLVQRMNSYDLGIKEAGLTEAPIPKWLDTPMSYWKNDVLLRIQILNREQTLKELSKDINEIEKLIDPAVIQVAKFNKIVEKHA